MTEASPTTKFSHIFVSEILKSYDSSLHLLEHDLSRSTSAGDNYMSIIYSLKLKVKNEKSGNSSELPWILKALPTNPPILQYMRSLKAFEKEIVMFEKVFPELCQEIQYESLPKAIFTNSDGKDDYIIMDDLRLSGYKMADRVKGLDFDHAKFVISEMSKFHALSFIKFQGHGQNILASFPELVDMFWVKPDQVSDRNHGFIQGQLAGVKQVMIEENLEHIIPRIERQFGNVFERMHRLASVPENFPSVINLGDCWTNNIMFKYDQEGNVTSIKFLDFQLARVTSRCSDLAYLLYTSVNIPILNERLNELLQIYHDSFNTFIRAHSSNTSLSFQGQDLTWEYLNIEFEHYRSHGTTLALIYTPLMLPSFDTVPDLDQVDGKDLENMGTSQSSDFAQLWKCKAVREKLIAVASGHLPMCFKPAQPSAS